MAIDTTVERAIKDGLAAFALAFRQEVDAPQRRLYVRGLADVAADVIEFGADRLLKEPGRKFFPTLPEWIGACADAIDEKRSVLARQARAFLEDCPDCHGSGFTDAEGPNSVLLCRCKARAREIMAQAHQPMKRPALPPMSEPGDAA